MTIQAGFLIVKTFEQLYQDYVQRYQLSQSVYAIPRVDLQPNDYKIQYRGIDRDALDPYENSDNLAEIRMDELVIEHKCEEGFLFSFEIIHDVLSYIENIKQYEVVWTRIANSDHLPPKSFISIGFEPSYFTSDHFSALCDCMLIPRWHGTDKEGTLFQNYYRQLNPYGLFDTAFAAKDFLNFYLSFDWTETGNYEIAEVFIDKSVVQL